MSDYRRIAHARRFPLAFLVIGAVALLFAACGGTASSPPATDKPAAAGHEIAIELTEWAVVPDATTAAPGEVTFTIENIGEETHEFVVIKTDLGSLDLPTAKDGSVKEGGPLEVVDEIEDIPSGASESLTVDLETGHYVLICNILEEEENGELESHYQMGMRVDFEVTE